MLSDLLSAVGLQWPYFCRCFFVAVTTPFVVLIFDLKWWLSFLLAGAIFLVWLILGIILQIAYGGDSNKNAAPPAVKPDKP